jgi:hypothetical protein
MKIEYEKKKKQLDDMSIWKVNGIWVWIYIPSKVEFLKYYHNEFLNIYVHRQGL